MIAHKRVEGEIVYNDGEFAEVEIYEHDLLMETIQLHVEDTSDTPEEFQRRFPVGTWLNIWTRTVVTPQPTKSAEEI